MGREEGARESLYDVTSCLAACSHVLCPGRSGVSVMEGLCPGEGSSVGRPPRQRPPMVDERAVASYWNVVLLPSLFVTDHVHIKLCFTQGIATLQLVLLVLSINDTQNFYYIGKYYYEMEICPMLHSAVKFRQNMPISRK